MTARLEQRFGALRQRGEKGVLPYITAGDGGLDTTLEVMRALERAGAAGIELGLPFSDPIADGPALQAAAQRALEAGTTLERVLDVVRRFRVESELPLVLMTYANPLVRRGLARACGQLAEAGLDGVLVVDLPLEEAAPLLDAARAVELAVIFFASPTSSDERIRRAARASRGYLYAIGRLGVTGRRTALDESTLAFLRRVRELSGDLAVAAGFGIAAPEQVRAVHAEADLAIVGTALVEHVHRAASSGSRTDPARAAAAAEEFLRPMTLAPASQRLP
jgi:tryptophan synthase alpha chain